MVLNTACGGDRRQKEAHRFACVAGHASTYLAPEWMTDDSVPDDEPITRLLQLWSAGDTSAGQRAFSLVYDELRRMARRMRRAGQRDDTLDTTALVHEVYLRFSGANTFVANDRAHFLAIAARVSRQVLSNYARARLTAKRGSGRDAVSLGALDRAMPVGWDGEERSLSRLWELEAALQRLQSIHPRPCRVIECRFFGGMSIPETAIALNVSAATVKRDWELAQAWLYDVLRESEALDV